MTSKTDEALLSKAKHTVYHLLKFRPRSRKEILTKLQEKRFPPEAVEETVEYFIEIGLINDRQFAQGWISSRRNRGFGLIRIEKELKEKGLAPEIIQEELKETTDEATELKTAKILGEKRASRYPGLDKNKVKQRVYGYLIRRGFSYDTAIKALPSLFR